MPAPTRFWLILVALLALPAALSLAGHGDLLHALRYLPLNYLWLATPHLVVALLAFSPAHRNFRLLAVIAALDVVLIGFWLWVLLAVPSRESGLAWVLYLPIAASELAILAVAALILRSRRASTTVGA